MSIAELVMLINSGVWVFMHKSLSRDTQTSAMDGLIATVLLAAAWALLPVQDLLPVPRCTGVARAAFSASKDTV